MVGGGQLARMTQQAAIALGTPLRVLSDSAHASAAKVIADVRIGDHRSLDDLRAFAKGADVITWDHEHVPGEHIRALEEAGVACRPGSAALLHAQDKRVMRERLTELGVPCPEFVVLDPAAPSATVEAFAEETGWPVVLKATRGGYDGKGVWVCASSMEASAVIERATAEDIALLAEQ